MYTATEYAEMLIIYGECRRNAREDAREYAIRFPRRLPHPNYNYGWCTVLESSGTPVYTGCPRTRGSN
jgi:hypothetical protein